jgi:uncharacterized protein DUF6527
MPDFQGRRVPDGTFHDGKRQPGDYGVGHGGENAGLWVVLPTGTVGRLDPNLWDWVEQPDGSLTVTPSIHDAPDGWHGWLRDGNWVV